MRVVLIDPLQRTITEETMNPRAKLTDAYRLLGCKYVELAAVFNLGNHLFVDEEGLCEPKGLGTFKLALPNKRLSNLLWGRGLVIGISGDTWSSCTLSPKALEPVIVWGNQS